MTKRLVLALVGTTVVVLVLVGGGTALLARAGARQSTETELERQVTELAASIPDPGEPGAARIRSRLLTALRRTLRLEGLTAVTLTVGGTIAGDLPAGLNAADVPTDRLAAGEVVSGHRGDLVFAAAPVPVGRRAAVIVATRAVDTGLGRARGWFVIAALATLGLAVVVAGVLGRRLTRPLRRAREVTARIAAGDLAARLPEPPPAAHDELADLDRAVNAMAAALEQAAAAERRFLLSVSHDLRTPLTSIRGYAEAITDGTTPDPAAAAAVISTQAQRLERLVADLLDLARLRAHASFSLHRRRLDLHDVAVTCAHALAPAAATAGIGLTVAPGPPCPVEADGQRLQQAVGNLVDNALRHARTRVAVSAVAEEADAVLTVDDDGPGIDPAHRDDVFTRLYPSAANGPSGAGVGLALSRELVVAMGGQLVAGEAPDGGARLTLRLPSAAPADQAVALSSKTMMLPP